MPVRADKIVIGTPHAAHKPRLTAFWPCGPNFPGCGEYRIDTLGHAREAGLKICCGGIVGMGEQVGDRLGMLMLLANLSVHPESVPINLWNEVKGVPVNDTAERPDPIALVRMIAVARIMMPKRVVRLSAGRQYMTDELQALSPAVQIAGKAEVKAAI